MQQALQVRHSRSPDSLETATNAQLRERYLVSELFVPGAVRGVYSHEDRMVIAGAAPATQALQIPAWEAIGTTSHLVRRELGIVNVGEPGDVIVDGAAHRLDRLDGLYVGRGSEVELRGAGACFFLVSAAADCTHPLGQFGPDTVTPMRIGATEQASARSVYRYVWDGGHPSCQLQFGVTVLDERSVWNTLPPHVHDRRSEVYLYLLGDPAARVVHLMGQPGASRHLLVADREAVLSPCWSVHAGAGTSSYAFVWAMAGENRDYGDVVQIPIEQL